MATEFDPIRAANEEIASMGDILRTLSERERAAEEAMSKAENELNAIRKLRGFASMERDRLIDKRLRLDIEAEKGEGPHGP